jgi:hypothetical protein
MPPWGRFPTCRTRPSSVRRGFLHPRQTLDGMRVFCGAASSCPTIRASTVVLFLAPFAQQLSTISRCLSTFLQRRMHAKADFQRGRTLAKLNSIGTLHIAARVAAKHAACDWHGGCITQVVSTPVGSYQDQGRIKTKGEMDHAKLGDPSDGIRGSRSGTTRGELSGRTSRPRPSPPQCSG